MRSLATIAVVFCAGCASYQYDVVQPTDHAAHVTTDRPVEFTKDDLQYRLIEYDQRLVMEVFNATDTAIEMTDGSAVDPGGASHPIPGQSLPPKGMIKEILPPIRPPAPDSSATVSQPPQIGPVDRPGYVLPRGYNPSDPSGKFDPSPVYWDWDGPGEMQIHLEYNAGGKILQHDFTFHRVKK